MGGLGGVVMGRFPVLTLEELLVDLKTLDCVGSDRDTVTNHQVGQLVTSHELDRLSALFIRHFSRPCRVVGCCDK